MSPDKFAKTYFTTSYISMTREYNPDSGTEETVVTIFYDMDVEKAFDLRGEVARGWVAQDKHGKFGDVYFHIRPNE